MNQQIINRQYSTQIFHLLQRQRLEKQKYFFYFSFIQFINTCSNEISNNLLHHLVLMLLKTSQSWRWDVKLISLTWNFNNFDNKIIDIHTQIHSKSKIRIILLNLCVLQNLWIRCHVCIIELTEQKLEWSSEAQQWSNIAFFPPLISIQRPICE